ncbi:MULTISPECIES: DUF488 domain-containing protein [Legionella]|uniref:DUF488 domain-containing protein n=1 Tax=Legionella septentrionalis TaxID=2498109 RepID=A0A433JGJ2_9GAMM|nr:MULTISPECIES: DUF488 domain-containing protein [Legionella]MCP0913549.1 DUF488 domain-containing protein [Legionella sp. 27cVA30]RUQ79212.1 DUF488 domain-containing protein [Legionella septentrionalis]RUQ99777.1 DUF488 domain-containing protein [Legionella septentrionalis]RUR11029.1 DUF488 domain-containing protein [Legionella septentrionalis]RUR15903.1 DUF488 domain-containing protein [Legionella septentrionalis]
MPKLYTIGHSTHPLEDFIEILHIYRITHLVDVRTVPKSRHVPWFNQSALTRSLCQERIAYSHIIKLGGLRKSKPDSINTGWRNKSFRGYADYMQTRQFYEGLKELHSIIKHSEQAAIMCAEAVPWRCHRSLIGDAESIRHVEVIDILGKNSIRKHELTSFAVVDKSTRPYQIHYPK